MTWPRVLPMPPCADCSHRRLSHFTPARFRLRGRSWLLIELPAPCSIKNCACSDYVMREAS